MITARRRSSTTRPPLKGSAAAVAIAVASIAGCHGSSSSAPAPSRLAIAPSSWPAADRERYGQQNLQFNAGKRLEAVGPHGVISGTTGPLAIHAGYLTLKAGGTAADAVIATSLAQIALAAGSWVSYAGFLSGLYYDAKTHRVSSLNAAFAIPRGETDPLSIPRGAIVVGTPSGRSALVPGYMAGIEALHRRFGKLPFATLFAPAIELADSGFPVSAGLAGMMAQRQPVLARLPETKAVYLKADGSPYKAGEVFRQPALGTTLRRVAAEGARYMYRGAWAEHLVAAVARDGGKLTLDDLAAYQPIWAEPLGIDYRGRRVLTSPRPNFGGAATLVALNLIEAANLPATGSPAESPQSFYRLAQAIQATDALGVFVGGRVSDPLVAKHLGGLDVSSDALLTKAGAKAAWDVIASPRWNDFMDALRADRAASSPGSDHSDAVVAVDAEGNMAVFTHTINTVIWGTTGINVDGVSIPDAASFQQEPMKVALERDGPGARVPDPTNPVMVLQNGRPVIGGSSIGSGLLQATVQSLVYLLDFGLSPQTAVDAPQFLGPAGYTSSKERLTLAVVPGSFEESLLGKVRALGQPVIVGNGAGPGTWVVVTVDPVTGERRGGGHSRYNGIAEAY